MLFWPFLGNGYTCNQITNPLVYDESLSIAQQIAAIMGRLSSIDSDYLHTDEFKAFVDQLNLELENLLQEAKTYTDTETAALETKIINFISDLQIGMLIWDVTLGRYNRNVDAMRDTFNDVTVHAITVQELSELPDITVDSLTDCGLNVRGLAVFSGWLVGEEFEPEGVFYTPPANQKLTCSILAKGEVKNGFFTEGGVIDGNA